MSDDDGSLFDSVRRTLTGPTAAERAAELSDRADEACADFDDDEIDELAELLDHDDPDVVGTTLDVMGSLAEECPDRCVPALTVLARDLTNRTAEEWSETTLGESSTSFVQDLHRGAILLSVAEYDPALLGPVADELASKMTEEPGRLEPQSTFALAHVAAADPDRVDVSNSRFVELGTRQLRSVVESDDNDAFGLQIQPVGTVTLVELLAELGDDDALDALEYARTESDREEVVAAATEAIDRLS